MYTCCFFSASSSLLTVYLYLLVQCCLSDGLAAFRTFLKSEFSDENIEFWMACEEYKKIKNSSKLLSKATKIYKEFIDSQAPREVCVCVCVCGICARGQGFHTYLKGSLFTFIHTQLNKSCKFLNACLREKKKYCKLGLQRLFDIIDKIDNINLLT